MMKMDMINYLIMKEDQIEIFKNYGINKEWFLNSNIAKNLVDDGGKSSQLMMKNKPDNLSRSQNKVIGYDKFDELVLI
jgi:hypothetical protein